jgi:hypothetical protein
MNVMAQPNIGVIRTTIVRSPRDLEAVATLWRQVYGEEFGWLRSNPSPWGDRYHERSTYFVCWLDETTPIGTLRIVREQNAGFHITKFIPDEQLVEKFCKTVEVQRLMVREDYRDRRFEGAPFGIFGCLVKACLQFAIRERVSLLLADCHKETTIGPMKSMKQMGFKETGHIYVDEINGLECVVMTLPVATWLQNIYRSPSYFNNYLISIDTSIEMDK